MPEISFDQVDNYQTTAGNFNYLTLKNNGDLAKVRFYIEDITDLKFNVVHRVKNKDGKTRYVNCIRNYDQPIDDCPFCKRSLADKDFRATVKLFLPVLDLADNQVKIFERGRTFKDEIVGHIRRNSPLVNYPCEIERCGEAGSTDTVYKVYPLAQEKDNTMKKDLPEVPTLLGGYVLDLTYEQMQEFLETGKFPTSNSNDDKPLPRRTSTSDPMTNVNPIQNRTNSRF